MFTRFETTIKLTALFLILCLCSWSWFQSQKIDSLKAENQAQAQIITNQSAVISQLKLQAEENQRITLELSKQEIESRRQSDEVIKSIPKSTKESNPFNSRAPDSVVEFLRQ